VLVAAAVCPHPPLLVPELAAGAGAELDRLRAACDGAVSWLLDVDADLLVVAGAADAVGPFPEGAWGSLHRYGVDIPVGGGSGEPPSLPLSLTVGRWLLERQSAVPASTLFFGVTADADAQLCRQLGATLGDRADRVAMLVMGDASARRSLKGPAYLDDRAEPYDESVARALGAADAAALLGLDPALSGDLLAAGRPAWQVLAGAAVEVPDASWSGRLLFEDSPYGVTYLVATWITERAGEA